MRAEDARASRLREATWAAEAQRQRGERQAMALEDARVGARRDISDARVG